jgi:hypothetical protein
MPGFSRRIRLYHQAKVNNLGPHKRILEAEVQRCEDGEEEKRHRRINRARLAKLYEEVNPDKVKSVDMILKKYQGRLDLLEKRLTTLYGKGFNPLNNQSKDKKRREEKRCSVDLSKVPERRQEWEIHIMTLAGRPFSVIVHPYETVQDLRTKISIKEDCCADQIVLIVNGRILNDGETLLEWKIADGSIVHMIFRLRGG